MTVTDRPRNGDKRALKRDELARSAPEVAEVSAPSLDASGDLSTLTAPERKAVLTAVGKEIASEIGSRALLSILAHSNMSMRQLARYTGFDVSVLSNIANGKRASGPDLWTLVALADAVGLDLKLQVTAQ